MARRGKRKVEILDQDLRRINRARTHRTRDRTPPLRWPQLLARRPTQRPVPAQRWPPRRQEVRQCHRQPVGTTRRTAAEVAVVVALHRPPIPRRRAAVTRSEPCRLRLVDRCRRDAWGVAPHRTRRILLNSWPRCPFAVWISFVTPRYPRVSINALSVQNSTFRRRSRINTASNDTLFFTTKAIRGRYSRVRYVQKNSPGLTKWRIIWKPCTTASCRRTAWCRLVFFSRLSGQCEGEVGWRSVQHEERPLNQRKRTLAEEKRPSRLVTSKGTRGARSRGRRWSTWPPRGCSPYSGGGVFEKAKSSFVYSVVFSAPP